MQNLNLLLKQTFKNYNIQKRDSYYITNIIIRKYLNCFNFIWNRLFYNIYKYYYSAKIFVKSLENYDNVVNETKNNWLIILKISKKFYL